MPNDLELVRIYERSTWGAGFICDAIQALRDDPSKDVTKDLGEALLLLTKAAAEIQQILSVRQ